MTSLGEGFTLLQEMHLMYSKHHPTKKLDNTGLKLIDNNCYLGSRDYIYILNNIRYKEIRKTFELYSLIWFSVSPIQ